MACYISSNDNRFYAAIEQQYGTVAAVTAADRFPGVSLRAAQSNDLPQRRDKTGTRTWQGVTGTPRRRTSFTLETYLVSREDAGQAPGYGPMIRAALGGEPRAAAALQVASASGTSISTTTNHGLSEGMAVTFGGEIRAVMATPDAQTMVLAAPFTTTPGAGSMLGATVSFGPAKQLPSVSLYDCWSPVGSVQRLLRGTAVDKMEIRVNGDFHEIGFEGIAADLLDSASFETGQGGLTQFPVEPAVGDLIYSPVPGHLGQAWVGVGPSRFHTVTSAQITVDNNLETRRNEFGMIDPLCLVTGERVVSVEFDLYSRDDVSFNELYQAARQRSPVACFMQLGEIEGELCGVYVKSFVPEVPEFIDDENRLRWRFKASRAQGAAEDEIYVTFG
ncbi:MAG TPA: hypothetical protein PKJ41_03560 [Bryobacteraceae bacterium]|nr:hypothetical protein [Bryobacteraceae bacterium]